MHKNIYIYKYIHKNIYIYKYIYKYIYIQGVSFDWGCLYYNWGILSKNPGQSNTPNRLKAEKWPKLAARSKKVRFYDPDCSDKQKKCMSNHHCHRNVAFLAQVFMHS